MRTLDPCPTATAPRSTYMHVLRVFLPSPPKCTMGRFADTRRFGQGTNTPAHFTWYDSPTSREQNKKTRSFNFNVHLMIRPTANVILAVVSFQMAKRQVYRLSSGQLLCQILLTRAQGTCFGEPYKKGPAKMSYAQTVTPKTPKRRFWRQECYRLSIDIFGRTFFVRFP